MTLFVFSLHFLTSFFVMTFFYMTFFWWHSFDMTFFYQLKNALQNYPRLYFWRLFFDQASASHDKKIASLKNNHLSQTASFLSFEAIALRMRLPSRKSIYFCMCSFLKWVSFRECRLSDNNICNAFAPHRASHTNELLNCLPNKS